MLETFDPGLTIKIHKKIIPNYLKIDHYNHVICITVNPILTENMVAMVSVAKRS